VARAARRHRHINPIGPVNLVSHVAFKCKLSRYTEGLITPVQLRDQLTHIREKKVLVVKVVDVTDFHGGGCTAVESSALISLKPTGFNP
jgi:hypothetical protein